ICGNRNRRASSHIMKMNSFFLRVSRRSFHQTGAKLAAATAITPTIVSPASAAEPVAPQKIIGIQAGAVSFSGESVDQTVGIFQERGAVTTVFLTPFTYGRGLGGRQIPGQPFPDHGKPESDQKTFHGGNYATPHAEFYKNTVLKQTRAPDHGDL